MKTLLQAGMASLLWLASLLSPWMPFQKHVEQNSNSAATINTNARVLIVKAAPVHVARKHAVTKAVKAPAPDLSYGRFRDMPAFTCRLAGRLSYDGMPYRQGVLMIRVRSREAEVTRTLHAATDGSFDISLGIDGLAGDPLDWEIRGQTIDQKPLTVSGRQIMVEGEQVVSIPEDLVFQDD